MNGKLNEFLLSITAWSFELMAGTVRSLPRSCRYPVTRIFGRLFGVASRSLREALDLNLKTLLNLSGRPLKKMKSQIFQNFALTLHDFFFPDQITVEVPDRAKLEALRERHKSLLFLTFHMGHWELGARTLAQWGWPVTAVYQPYRNKQFKKVIEKRRAKGVSFIAVGGNAAQGVREALKTGRVVAMLGDHPFGEQGIPVTLLGHSVLWPKGPVLLAVRENVPIVVAVIIRTGPYRYKALIEDPLLPQNHTRTEVERLIQEVANKFGKLLTLYPTQWYRFRKFEFVPSNNETKGVAKPTQTPMVLGA